MFGNCREMQVRLIKSAISVINRLATQWNREQSQGIVIIKSVIYINVAIIIDLRRKKSNTNHANLSRTNAIIITEEYPKSARSFGPIYDFYHFSGSGNNQFLSEK